MQPEFMMFINASINLDHRQFTFQLESMFWALWVLEEKYIFIYKWVEVEGCACIIFLLRKHFYKSHKNIQESVILKKKNTVDGGYNYISSHAWAVFPYTSQEGLSVCWMHMLEQSEINLERW